ncbi:porin family protein [Psychrobacter lutiphocae]|uniref:porin family protein n=1 Tax=Psychrobacter lutiphocae TaxID=540500 RepID=UPI00037E0E92|nr:porin family protein [Psychrobacter lutiphocae]
MFNKALFAVAVATASSLVSVGATAAVNYGNGMVVEPYVGIKFGQYDLDHAEDKGISYGVYGGAKFTSNFGIEAEYLGSSDEDYQSDFSRHSEYHADVYGIYGTAQYLFPATPVYVKGRVGVAKNKVKVDARTYRYWQHEGGYSDSGLAGGLGFGYNLAPNASVEIAYDWYPKIDNLADQGNSDATGITLGAHMRF